MQTRTSGGNVLVVISDKKLPHCTEGTTDYYTAEVLQATDYSAFHATLKDRVWYANTADKYRYGGSNGQEKDDDIFEGAYTAEYWEYDSRLGRRWNVDPVVKEWESPYACFSNNPVYFSDVLGLDSDPPKNPVSAPKEGQVYTYEDGTKIKYKDGAWQLPEAKTLAKFFDKLNNFFDRVYNGVRDFLISAGVFVLGVTNAWGSNQLFGKGRENPNNWGSYASVARSGQTTGDVISIISAAVEFSIGGGLIGAGVTISVTGVGAIVGVPAAGVGVGMQVHGSAVIGVATANIIKDVIVRAQDNSNGHKSTGGSSDGNGLKKFSNKWDPDKPIKDQIKGQLGKLLKQFNVKGFNIEDLVKMTPRQAEEFLKGKEGANKVFQQINKALQDGGHYYK